MGRSLDDRKRAKKVADRKQNSIRTNEVRVRGRQDRKLQFQVDQQMKFKPTPIRRVETKEDILARMERNLEILKGLEAEFDSQMAAKADRNETLESEGITKLKDKMDALHRQAIEDMKAATKAAGGLEMGLEMGGEADVAFTPYKNSAEVD